MNQFENEGYIFFLDKDIYYIYKIFRHLKKMTTLELNLSRR